MSEATSPILDGFSGTVEFSAAFEARSEISHVIFDFDGTSIEAPTQMG